MARKKTPGPKKPSNPPARRKPAKPEANPPLTIFSFTESDPGFDDDSLDDLLPAEYFMAIFEEDNCLIEHLEPGVFFAGRDDAYKFVVDVTSDLPFVSLKIPLKVKPGTSKAKVLDWINERTCDFPMLRLFRSDPQIVMSTFDYLYDISCEPDEEHFIMVANTFWNLNLIMIREASEGIIDENWLPGL